MLITILTWIISAIVIIIIVIVGIIWFLSVLNHNQKINSIETQGNREYLYNIDEDLNTKMNNPNHPEVIAKIERIKKDFIKEIEEAVQLNPSIPVEELKKATKYTTYEQFYNFYEKYKKEEWWGKIYLGNGKGSIGYYILWDRKLKRLKELLNK